MYPNSTNKINANFETNVFDSKKLGDPLTDDCGIAGISGVRDSIYIIKIIKIMIFITIL
jgi:hypothetical protein